MLPYPLSAVSDLFVSGASPRTDELITSLAASHGEEFLIILAATALVGSHGDRTNRDNGLQSIVEQLVDSGLPPEEAAPLVVSYFGQLYAAMRADLRSQSGIRTGHRAPRYCPAPRRPGVPRQGDAT